MRLWRCGISSAERFGKGNGSKSRCLRRPLSAVGPCVSTPWSGSTAPANTAKCVAKGPGRVLHTSRSKLGSLEKGTLVLLSKATTCDHAERHAGRVPQQELGGARCEAGTQSRAARDSETGPRSSQSKNSSGSKRLLRRGLTNFDLVGVSSCARGTAHDLAWFALPLPFFLPLPLLRPLLPSRGPRSSLFPRRWSSRGDRSRGWSWRWGLPPSRP